MLGVKTIGNATLIAYDDVAVLATDPWFGDEDPAFFGSWWLPYRIPAAERSDIQRARYIWFSHGHQDHLNPNSIESLRHLSILLPDHVGGRIRNDLESQGYNVRTLPDGRWVQLSKRIRIYCIADYNQDAILLVDVGGRLFIDMNDTEARTHTRIIRGLAREFSHSYLLRLAGYSAGMINFVDQNGNRVERKFEPSVGHGLALSAQRVGAKSVIPFSSFQRFQREDSAWANDYEVPLSGYRQGFDERLAEFIPPFVWIDCASGEILNLDPPEAPFVLHKPEEFGDSWSDELSSDDRRVINGYFRRKEKLHDMLGFIRFEVGGKSHTIDLAGPCDRGITFVAPRNSLMAAVTHKVFDDLGGANFMRATLHNLESLYSPQSLYSPSFNAVVGKWGVQRICRDQEANQIVFGGISQ